MPGKINQAGTDHNYFTRFRAQKSGITVASTDPAVDANVAAEIDLEHTDIGFGNVIIVALERAAGTGAVNITLYRKFISTTNLGSITDWKPMEPDESGPYCANSGAYKEVLFTGLMPATYRVLISTINNGDSWNVHTCHNATRLSRSELGLG